MARSNVLEPGYKVLFEHIPIEKQKRSAAEPQPKDDRIGFAACCEDVAVPFRIEAPLGFGLRPPIRNHARAQPKIKRGTLAEGQSRILTTGGEAVTKKLLRKTRI